MGIVLSPFHHPYSVSLALPAHFMFTALAHGGNKKFRVITLPSMSCDNDISWIGYRPKGPSSFVENSYGESPRLEM